MSLNLDFRQRAMLQEMGIAVWQPVDVVATIETMQDVVADLDLSLKHPQNTIKIIANNQENKSATDQNRPIMADVKSAPQQPIRALQPLPADLQQMDWQTLQQAAQSCQACPLSAGRKHSVFGELTQITSVSSADWFIVGDPPIESDEVAGAPFTGEAGVLLGNMLKAMGLRVEQVTLTPAVKCRTEGQSTGQQEVAQCAAYLHRQITLTQPKIILAMGRYAAQALLAQSVSNPVPPLGQLRGVVHSYAANDQHIPVVVTYSPANLMRNTSDKAKAWADLCLAMATLRNVKDQD